MSHWPLYWSHHSMTLFVKELWTTWSRSRRNWNSVPPQNNAIFVKWTRAEQADIQICRTSKIDLIPSRAHVHHPSSLSRQAYNGIADIGLSRPAVLWQLMEIFYTLDEHNNLHVEQDQDIVTFEIRRPQDDHQVDTRRQQFSKERIQIIWTIQTLSIRSAWKVKPYWGGHVEVCASALLRVFIISCLWNPKIHGQFSGWRSAPYEWKETQVTKMWDRWRSSGLLLGGSSVTSNLRYFHPSDELCREFDRQNSSSWCFGESTKWAVQTKITGQLRKPVQSM